MSTPDTTTSDLIRLRALPPVGMLGGATTHFLGLTDGPRIACVGVDQALGEILAYKAALLGGVANDKASGALRSRRSRDLMADAQLIVIRVQPLAVIWEVSEEALLPFLLLSDNSALGLSTTMASTLHIAYDIPLLVDRNDFSALAIPMKVPTWTPADLFTYYSQRALGGEYESMDFDTTLPPQLAAFFEAGSAGATDADPEA